jgi:2-hydroxychromene-2-carboxylate isomerase
MTIEADRTPVKFYFDPLCPWAWLTSLWVRQVRDQGLVDVEWKFFSLAGINDREDQWHGPLRICALARQEGGNEAVDRAYLALGRLWHEEGDAYDRIGELAEMVKPFLADVGLDPSLAERALADPATLETVMADHREAVETLGAFGVPWLVVADDERGFFGPVIGELLPDDEAVELWEHFRWMGTRPYLYELKRGGRKKLQSLAGLSARFAEPAPVGS